jgi:hypothetical protein
VSGPPSHTRKSPRSHVCLIGTRLGVETFDEAVPRSHLAMHKMVVRELEARIAAKP